MKLKGFLWKLNGCFFMLNNKNSKKRTLHNTSCFILLFLLLLCFYEKLLKLNISFKLYYLKYLKNSSNLEEFVLKSKLTFVHLWIEDLFNTIFIWNKIEYLYETDIHRFIYYSYKSLVKLKMHKCNDRKFHKIGMIFFKYFFYMSDIVFYCFFIYISFTDKNK